MNVIKTKRKALGLNQSDVAKLVGCSNQYYNMVENGKRKPSVTTAKEIARVLKVDWTIFFKDEINQKLKKA